MEEIFNGMEAAGLHQILKKHFVQENRTIKTRRVVQFDVPRSHKKYSLHHRRSTPYPPLLLSKFVSSSDDSLPTGSYRTVSRYPLDGGFMYDQVILNHQLQLLFPNKNKFPLSRPSTQCQKSRWTGLIIKEEWDHVLIPSLLKMIDSVNQWSSAGYCYDCFYYTFYFIFIDTLFAATSADNYSMFLINDTLPQCSLVSFFFCFIFTKTASTL